MATDFVVLRLFLVPSSSDSRVPLPTNITLVCSSLGSHCVNTYLAPDLLVAAFAVGTLARLAGVTGSSLLCVVRIRISYTYTYIYPYPSDEREIILHAAKSIAILFLSSSLQDIPAFVPVFM